jgi:acetyl-CoA carboxylase carboxyl transferase subunit alpha
MFEVKMADEIKGLDFEKPIIELEERIQHLKNPVPEDVIDHAGEIKALEEKLETVKNQIYGSLSTWQRVMLARHPKRPYTLDYVRMMVTDFVELHGDRAFADDKAMICGLGAVDGIPIAVIGHQKGRSLHENLDRNFAMAHPEGYRKALRIMKLAEKFGLSIVTFVDTPGAYPGIAAEERGQAEAIARNLREMSDLRVPVVCVVIGEGGSGGALGIGVANRILMLENSYYSVISPEGCAAILFRDASKAAEAAAALKITAQDLQKIGVVDEIIAEPLGGAHRDHQFTAEKIKASIVRHIKELQKLSPDNVARDRYEKFKRIGSFTDSPKASKRKEIIKRRK